MQQGTDKHVFQHIMQEVTDFEDNPIGTLFLLLLCIYMR